MARCAASKRFSCELQAANVRKLQVWCTRDTAVEKSRWSSGVGRSSHQHPPKKHLVQQHQGRCQEGSDQIDGRTVTPTGPFNHITTIPKHGNSHHRERVVQQVCTRLLRVLQRTEEAPALMWWWFVPDQ